MIYICKYAALLTALAILMASIAVPYMIPENPDSAVFRSGTLGLILLCAGAYSVYKTFTQADRRTFICSIALGFLFAMGLSLGSELFIYDELLPGLGSMIRRTAVPLLAAPYLGGIITQVILINPRSSRQWHFPLSGYTLIIFSCWLPLLLAYFPGMLNYDFVGEYMQHVDGVYSNIHPLLHSAVMNGIITLGELLHSRTLGVLLMTLIQMGIFAFSLGYSCTFAQKRGAPAAVLLILTALYALHPIFSVMALSMTKDTLFAAAILVLSLLTWELLDAPSFFFKSRMRCMLYIFCTVTTALMRKNGIFALAALLPGIIITLRGMRKHACVLAAACVCSCMAVTIALNLIYTPTSMPSFQLYSLPAQQLVRSYNTGIMTDSERVELESWYTSPEGLALHPHLADPAKGYLDRERIEMEGGRFLSLWLQVGAKNIRAYAEAFLMLNVGSWYPDDLSHSTIYPDVSWNDKGYLQTQEYDMTEKGIETVCYLPMVKTLYERICRRNEYQKYPLFSVFFCPAVPFWLLMLSGTILICRHQTRLLPALSGAFGLWLSYLLGPCTLPRYALPLFCLVPVTLISSLLSYSAFWRYTS